MEPDGRGEKMSDREAVTVVRARIAVGIVLLFTLVSGGFALVDLKSGAAGVTNYAAVTARFNLEYQALRSQLPSSGSIGFVTDSNDGLAFVLAHYNLAPLIMRQSAGERVVVGHFESREAASRFLSGAEHTDQIPVGAKLHAVVVRR